MSSNSKNYNSSDDMDITILNPEESAEARDKLLIQRVEYYLRNLNEDEINLECLTTYLRRKYKDYRSKNNRPTKSMVEKAVNIIAETEEMKRLNKDSSDIEYTMDIANDSTNDENDISLVSKENDATDQDVTSRDVEKATTFQKNIKNVHRNDDILKEIPMFEPTVMLNQNAFNCSDQVVEKSEKIVPEVTETNKKRKTLNKHNQESKKTEDKTLESVVKNKTKQFNVKNSTSTFHDIGGNEMLLADIVKKIKHIKNPEIIDHFKKKSPPRGFLLYGPSGCGKTLLARAIAGQLKIPLLEVAATDLVAGVTGESEENLRYLFDQAIALAPCVLFLDKIETLASNNENTQKGMEKRIVHQLCACLDKLSESENKDKIIVLGATIRLDSLDQSLRTPGRFEEEISLGIPNKDARIAILQILAKGVKLDPKVSLEKIASLTPGYVPSELDKLINEAEYSALNRISQLDSCKTLKWELDFNKCFTVEQLDELYVTEKDFEIALKTITPSIKKEGFVTVPNVTWSDVGSLKSIREELQLDILAPVMYPEMYDGDLEIETGVLLCGPPGCGKTMLAKAMANEAGINFISVKGAEFLNKYVGESEKNVHKCFDRARNAAPCIIFFDELDALCPKRSDIDGNATSRVVNAMLTELDGVCERKNVFVMAASNRPEIIDSALLRSGRFDKIIYVGLPQPNDRLEILQALTKNGSRPKLSKDVVLQKVANDDRCAGFSGADLKGLVKQARREYVRDKINGHFKGNEIKMKHFNKALDKIKPSVKENHLNRYRKLEKLYATDAKDNFIESKKFNSSIDSEKILNEDLMTSRVKKYLEKSNNKKINVTVTETASYLKNEFSDYEKTECGELRVMVRNIFNNLMGPKAAVLSTPRQIKATPCSINKSNNNSKRKLLNDNEECLSTPKIKKPKVSLDWNQEDLSDDNNINNEYEVFYKKVNKLLTKINKINNNRKKQSKIGSFHVSDNCTT